MAFPRKKLKLSGLAIELQRSPYMSDSNPETPNYRPSSMNNSSNMSLFSVSNSMMTTSIEYMNGFSLDRSSNQQNNESSQNILSTESFIVDQNNDVEMRINEWLDNQNIMMVRPEDVIHDFYHKMRISTLKKMEIELNIPESNEESLQSSFNDLDYDCLDYSHSKPIKNNRKSFILDSLQQRFNICTKSSKNDQIEIEMPSRLIKRRGFAKDNCLDSPQISSLLSRRKQTDNHLSISGSETNRFFF